VRNRGALHARLLWLALGNYLTCTTLHDPIIGWCKHMPASLGWVHTCPGILRSTVVCMRTLTTCTGYTRVQVYFEAQLHACAHSLHALGTHVSRYTSKHSCMHAHTHYMHWVHTCPGILRSTVVCMRTLTTCTATSLTPNLGSQKRKHTPTCTHTDT